MIRFNVFMDNQFYYCTLRLHILTVSGGNSPEVQWLALIAFTAGSGFNPWWGLKKKKSVNDPLELVPLFSGLCSKLEEQALNVRIWDLVENEVCLCVEGV